MVNGIGLAEDFATALNEKFPVVQSFDESFGITRGRKFSKIVRIRDGRPVSVFAFVELETGKLVKAAGWNAPAKLVTGELQSRYNLDTEFDAAINHADQFGSFLYVR